MNFNSRGNSNSSGKKVRDWVNFFKDEAKLKEFDQWIAINYDIMICHFKINPFLSDQKVIVYLKLSLMIIVVFTFSIQSSIR